MIDCGRNARRGSSPTVREGSETSLMIDCGRNARRGSSPTVREGSKTSLMIDCGVALEPSLTVGLLPRGVHWKYRVISDPIHFPTGTETPFPIIR
jgi:hypothetical protein